MTGNTTRRNCCRPRGIPTPLAFAVTSAFPRGQGWNSYLRPKSLVPRTLDASKQEDSSEKNRHTGKIQSSERAETHTCKQMPQNNRQTCRQTDRQYQPPKHQQDPAWRVGNSCIKRIQAGEEQQPNSVVAVLVVAVVLVVVVVVWSGWEFRVMPCSSEIHSRSQAVRFDSWDRQSASSAIQSPHEQQTGDGSWRDPGDNENNK